MRQYDDSSISHCSYEEYKAWTSLPFYEDLFHQMMCDVHNVALELKDEKQKHTLMIVANKLAILCDRCNKNFRTKIEF